MRKTRIEQPFAFDVQKERDVDGNEWNVLAIQELVVLPAAHPGDSATFVIVSVLELPLDPKSAEKIGRALLAPSVVLPGSDSPKATG